MLPLRCNIPDIFSPSKQLILSSSGTTYYVNARARPSLRPPQRQQMDGVIHGLLPEPPLAPVDEHLGHRCSFITPEASHVVVFAHRFHPVLHQTVIFRLSLGLNPPPPTCVSLEGLNPFSSILSLLFFSSRVLSGRNGTLRVKKRGGESIIKARRLRAHRRMVSPSLVCTEDHS